MFVQCTVESTDSELSEEELRRSALQSLKKSRLNIEQANRSRSILSVCVDDIKCIGNSPKTVGRSTLLSEPDLRLEQELRQQALLSLRNRVNNHGNMESQTSIAHPVPSPTVSKCQPVPAPKKFIITVSPDRNSDDEDPLDFESEINDLSYSPCKTFCSQQTVASPLLHRKAVAAKPPIVPPSEQSSLIPKQRSAPVTSKLTLTPETHSKSHVDRVSSKKKASLNGAKNTLMLRKEMSELQLRLEHKYRSLSQLRRQLKDSSATLSRLEAKLIAEKAKQNRLRSLIAAAEAERQATVRVYMEVQKKICSRSFNAGKPKIPGLSKRLDSSVPFKKSKTSYSFLLSRYCSRLLKKLEAAARIESPFLNYFSLFALFANMLDEVEMTPTSPVPGRSITKSEIAIDVSVPICPFFLNGSCIDLDCPLQHLGKYSRSAKRPYQTLVFPEDEFSDPKSFCSVCKVYMEDSKGEIPKVCTSVSDWHLVFSVAQDWTAYFSSPVVGDTAVLMHCLQARLLSRPFPVVEALQLLRETSFDSQLLLFALNSPMIASISSRRQLLRESLSCLLLSALDQRSLNDSIGCMNSIFWVVYSICRFEWELSGSSVGLLIIDELMSSTCENDSLHYIPPGHLTRWGLWYLKAIVMLSSTFPLHPKFCPYVDPGKLSALGSLFADARQDLDLRVTHLSNLFASCIEASIPVKDLFPILNFCHLYVQFLSSVDDNDSGADFCLRILASFLPFDNVFLPTAVFLASKNFHRADTVSFVDVSEFANRHNLSSAVDFCLCYLMQAAQQTTVCLSHLSNRLTTMSGAKLENPSAVYAAFQELTRVPCQETKANAYLLLCFGLFSVLHSCSSDMLFDVLKRIFTDLEDFNRHSFPFPLTAFLLHLGLALANLLPSPEEYLRSLEFILFPSTLVKDLNFRSDPPAWFLEILQYIRIDKFTEQSSPAALFTRLVETYGFRALKALFAGGGLRNSSCSGWLQNLCKIARMEQPLDEEFWLIVTALGVIFYPPKQDGGGQRLISYISECLSEAVKLLPLSCRLWQFYGVVCKLAQATAMQQKQILSLAGELKDVLEEVFKENAVNVSSKDFSVVDSLALNSAAEWWNVSSALTVSVKEEEESKAERPKEIPRPYPNW